jgi:hypothetical protein
MIWPCVGSSGLGMSQRARLVSLVSQLVEKFSVKDSPPAVKCRLANVPSGNVKKSSQAVPEICLVGSHGAVFGVSWNSTGTLSLLTITGVTPSKRLSTEKMSTCWRSGAVMAWFRWRISLTTTVSPTLMEPPWPMNWSALLSELGPLPGIAVKDGASERSGMTPASEPRPQAMML